MCRLILDLLQTRSWINSHLNFPSSLIALVEMEKSSHWLVIRDFGVLTSLVTISIILNLVAVLQLALFLFVEMEIWTPMKLAIMELATATPLPMPAD